MPRKVTRKQQPGPKRYPRIYAREWRNRAGLSIDKVVVEMDAIGFKCSKATISRVENAKQPFSQDILIGLSIIYKCTTLQLQYVNPRDPSTVRAVLDTLMMPIT